LSDVTL